MDRSELPLFRTSSAVLSIVVVGDCGRNRWFVINHCLFLYMQEVTGKKFGSSFRESLKDGVLLCE